MTKHGFDGIDTEPREWVSTVVCRCGEKFTAHGRYRDDSIKNASRAMMAHLASQPEPVKK